MKYEIRSTKPEENPVIVNSVSTSCRGFPVVKGNGPDRLDVPTVTLRMNTTALWAPTVQVEMDVEETLRLIQQLTGAVADALRK